MMNEFYTILSIFVTGGLLLACGLMFLFMVIPDSPLLDNYRKARCMMACAYLFFVALGIVEWGCIKSTQMTQIGRICTDFL
jgi:hypothetical protein